MEKMLRNFFLYLAGNKILTKMAKKYGLKFGASRFVAGETIERAVQVIQDLNQKGIKVTLDFLGEFISKESEANEMANNTIRSIKYIGEQHLDAQVSLKLTSMGMDISDEIVMRNMRKILEVAKTYDVFVTIDMEDHTRTEQTLKIFTQLKSEYDCIGTVIQAYLYRSQKDIEQLHPLSPRLRIVKGAYKEPADVAFPNKKEVDENYKKLVRTHLLNGHFTAIATHDDAMIEYTKQFVQNHKIANDQFEFQMLYGIRPERQLELVKEGFNMRVYVPYGTDWYGYFMRRLAERPANVGFVLKGIVKK
ncbi:proline dehydrogenase family protein [Heyndrickxia ginsengihumi]|uniref:proline dehydrogenase family protein n=1 Tax=Heyndrickxia ginsengihumi TaxID=363870 RepID=UPI0020426940|nr:proline dehydrogenase [Heyndrickxia ginsengihumi]MCM3023298.1 proline dehydrogenase [Heyndrickxia ginsengihumi]